MFESDMFEEWLEKESKDVLNKFKNNEPLSVEDKMILTLKAQTNHFHHLDQDIRKDISILDNKTMKAIANLQKDTDKKFTKVDKRFEQVDKRFEQVDKRFKQVDKRFEELSHEIKNIYQAINNQTWKMIGAIGSIIVLSKLIESLPLVKF